MVLQLTHEAFNSLYCAHQDPEADLNANEAASLLSISVHALSTHRAGSPPYTSPKFIKLGKWIIYKRKDLLA